MDKFLVIGSPIEHSLSPMLHNYWFKKKKINAIYEKKEIKEDQIKDIISDIKNDKIKGVNVTVPYKKKIIPFLDLLTPIAEQAQSVNTIYKNKNKIIGHNTDVSGLELALKHIRYDFKSKVVFILGAGGVVSSIILALKKLDVSSITLSNRTRGKLEDLKKNFTDLKIVDWGKLPYFDVIINATSLGLKNEDEIQIDYKQIGPNKLFYDVIYNPKQTNFLINAKKNNHITENGKMMFIYQAHQSFTLWNNLMPEIDDETIRLLDQ